ncbi:hypothetical protein, partial [Brasilonema sp. UFV-L1]|uniref:hypothetical protein n=1 Tax=Brasilonema sp. UFV-L1 TaxID=2234130 RepID=UPI001B7D1C29
VLVLPHRSIKQRSHCVGRGCRLVACGVLPKFFVLDPRQFFRGQMRRNKTGASDVKAAGCLVEGTMRRQALFVSLSA